jgi:predicted TIM-barrel fold metal-dependent hydrolase
MRFAMKIDLHFHAFPGGFFRAAKTFYSDAIELGQDEQRRLLATWAGTTLPAWDHAGRLADIDRAGIDIGILSCPPVYSRVDEHAPELCRLVNDAIAAACRRDPQRFRGFAHLPFNDMKLALEEMRRALDELGFVGVLVTSNIGGRYLDSAEFYPFWEEANRRRVPVFMHHPSSSPCYRDDQPGPLLSFPFDTTLSVYRLIYGGLYERLPDIVLIVAHLGGTLPFLARRTDLVFDVPGFFPGYKPPARRPSEWMRKLYVDTALGWNRGAFNCARELVGLDHIVFGTDYFVRSTRFMEWTIEFIDGLGLAASEREMIYEKNARQILNLGAA